MRVTRDRLNHRDIAWRIVRGGMTDGLEANAQQTASVIFRRSMMNQLDTASLDRAPNKFSTTTKAVRLGVFIQIGNCLFNIPHGIFQCVQLKSVNLRSQTDWTRSRRVKGWVRASSNLWISLSRIRVCAGSTAAQTMVRPVWVSTWVIVMVRRVRMAVMRMQRMRVAVMRVQMVLVVRVVAVVAVVVVRVVLTVVGMVGAMVRVVSAVVRVVNAVVRVVPAIVRMVRAVVRVVDSMVWIRPRVAVMGVVAMVAVQAVVRVGRVHGTGAPDGWDGGTDRQSSALPESVAELAVADTDGDLGDRLVQHHPVEEFAADLGQHGVGEDRVDHAPA